MYIEIRLPIKPFSINKAFLRNRKYSKAARQFRFDVLKELQTPSNKAKLDSISKAFDPKKHSFAVILTSYYPESTFFNQRGTVSARTLDLTNTEKLLVDCFFSPKYDTPKWLKERKGFERALYSPFKSLTNLKHDDVFITDLRSLKVPFCPSPEQSTPYQVVRISIIPFPCIS